MTETIENKLEWTAATHLIHEAQRILIVTHVYPDGDAIGSMLGLANALRRMGKHVDTAVDEGVPKFLDFLDNSEKVYAKLTTASWDVMVSVDASDEERSGMVGAYGRKHSQHVINLDHHATNTFFGDVHLVMVDAVSATEIVFRWLDHMELLPLNRAIAFPLLTGLVTDTMGFRTSNVKADTFGIAQQLMTFGASITEVTARTLDKKNYQTLQLWSRVLQSMQLDKQVISVTIKLDDLASVGLRDVSDSGLVGLLNQVDEAMVAVIFTEVHGGKVKVSLRSKRGFDVGTVAMTLGGGGHKQASGTTISGTVDEVREKVMPYLYKAVSEGRLIIA